MIKVTNLSKSFGEHILFERFNLEIEEGDFICISGKSGSGKTTLLNMLGMLENCEDGEMFYKNKNFKDINKLKFYRDEAGFVFQNFALVENKSVKQNLMMVPKKSRTDLPVEKALELVGLEDKEDEKIYSLSGGEQQRIALARLFYKKCDVIFCDEPTGSLDRENADKIMQILQKLNDSGKTIIIVTHDELIKSQIKKVVEL
ncbi:MAG: ATP-binding cassette domain-containing protein [Lactobacillales bacterium]|jgi:putative ABC transport system ATP-binding protein|nr:ATP-binding cassette domain-containing protein [Lactobacillales bacterium]